MAALSYGGPPQTILCPRSLIYNDGDLKLISLECVAKPSVMAARPLGGGWKLLLGTWVKYGCDI